ncbi:diguanylate cyclase [Ideonella sp. YS5]|uniref:ligand-binding sensor domain-containing diguanylate cyclase n=1 Tax=Ideonella sp. YS5 TaxID=3453714 RepID=UPI003EED5C9A
MALTLAMACPVHAEHASLREYGRPEGLDNLAVRTLAQDAEGFLWAGTENGLYRFDGGRFRRVGGEQGLSWVNALAPQADGLWIGTPAGLWWWRRGTLVKVSAGDAGPLAVLGLGSLAAGADRTLWVAAKSGLHKVTPLPDGQGWRAERVVDEAGRSGPGHLGGLLAQRDGTLWFGCAKALCRLRDGRTESFGPSRGVPSSFWNRLMLAGDGSVWARGGSHLVQMAPGAERFVQQVNAGLEADEAGSYALAEDAQHRILTVARSALLRWDGQRWERFGPAAGLSFDGWLMSLLVDREGGLWLGSGGNGLLQWRGYGPWENWSVGDGLPDGVVWRFLREKSEAGRPLYVGTGKGVSVWDPRARRFRFLASNASGAVDIGALAVDSQGVLWAGTWGGQVVRYSGSPIARGRVDATVGRGETIYGLLPDSPPGPLIIGLHRLYDWRPARPGPPPKPMDEAVVGRGTFGGACRGRDGHLWVGSEEGLVSDRAGRLELSKAGGGDIFRIACLQDGGLLVTNGEDRLHRIELQGDPFRRVDVTPAVLKGRSVVALLEDRRGWWWVSTDAGVAVFNGRSWRWLDQAAGLVWSDTSGGGLYEDADGTVWIGTSRGASHMLAPQALFEPVLGTVSIEEVRSGSRTVPLDARPGLALPWTQDALEVLLAAPVYGGRHAMRIEYRLTGFDDRWAAVPGDSVRLTGLPPGAYRFEARVIDHELGVASPATGFGFEIEPPWWRTPQAYALAIFGALVLGFIAHRWRVRQVVRHAQALEALVRHRTQELEASREQLRELATRDGLTGAWNRRALMEIIEREVGRARRERSPLTLLLADIDHFKRINDTFGHPAGDAVLREFVNRLTRAVRPYDAVGRYGGEEFVLVLPGMDAVRPDDGRRLQAVHAVIAAEPMPQAGRVTCSFGVVTLLPGMQADVDQLIAMADRALYRAKNNGRNRVEYAQESDEAPA